MKDRNWLSRTALLIGEQGLDKLQSKHVLVVGLGGIGSFAAEFLARSGIGRLTVVDGDLVESSNRNRQIPALVETEGMLKAEVMQSRLLGINPDLEVKCIHQFLDMEGMQALITSERFDYVVDAIDSLSPKVELLTACHKQRVEVVSCLGAGGRLNPFEVEVCDISKTHRCPFSKMVRKRLHAENIYEGITAVFSPELPVEDALMYTDGTKFKKSAYGTISYMPALFGLHAAAHIIRSFINQSEINE